MAKLCRGKVTNNCHRIKNSPFLLLDVQKVADNYDVNKSNWKSEQKMCQAKQSRCSFTCEYRRDPTFKRVSQIQWIHVIHFKFDKVRHDNQMERHRKEIEDKPHSPEQDPHPIVYFYRFTRCLPAWQAFPISSTFGKFAKVFVT